VYATLSGTVELRADRPEVVAVRGADATTVFEYWHIVAAVRAGQRVVAYRTIVGHVASPWAHVHFSERHGERYVNPLRPGALAPFADSTVPTVHAFSLERAGMPLGRRALSGRFDLVVEAFDRTPLAVPAPWSDKPVTPASVRWRLVGPGGREPWRTAVDYRRAIPADSDYDRYYAPWTRQNKPWSSGRYRFRLAADWDSRSVPDGRYRLDVLVTDTRGNVGRGSASFTLRNAPRD
jgi:hypothetical protein